MKVLIVDGSLYPSFYEPTKHWAAELPPGTWTSVRLTADEGIPEIPSLEGFTHLILTGSEDRIVEPNPWHEVEARILQEAVDRDLAVLGSCFGHQMLARALMGEDHTQASPTPEMGWVPIELLEDDPLLSGLESPVWMFCSHFDEVVSPPEPWRVLAKSADCAVQIMRFGHRRVWGIQAHPEIRPHWALPLLRGFLEKAPDKAHLIHPALKAKPRDDGAVLPLMKSFCAL